MTQSGRHGLAYPIASGEQPSPKRDKHPCARMREAPSRPNFPSSSRQRSSLSSVSERLRRWI
jgi:hypothetical protein